MTVILKNLNGQKEEIFFKGEELVKRNVGPEGTWYEYKDGKQVMEKEKEKVEKNLLDFCRYYSFPSEYFGITNFHAEQKHYSENAWLIYKDGSLHCEAGPARVEKSNRPEYFLGGQKLSKEEWLCLTDPKYRGPVNFGIENDKVSFFKNGELHRDFGPAIINQNGSRIWYKEGKLHREDGPALISYGEVQWAIDGELFSSGNDEWVEARQRYRELQQRKDRPAESPHIKKILGLKEHAEAVLVVNHTYSWVISKEVEGKRQSFFIDLNEMDIPEEISKSQEFGEALLESFLEEEWYNNWYSVSTNKKLDKIAKKYLDAAEAKAKENLKGAEVLSKDIAKISKLLKFDEIDELELVNRTLKKIDECHKDENKIDDLLHELNRPNAHGDLFIDQIKSIENKNIVIDAVAKLAQSLIVKEAQDNMKKAQVPVKVKRIEPMVFEKKENWVKVEPFDLPPETKKDKAKKSLGVVRDATKQGVKIGVATEGANIAYDSVKNMLINVLGISPKALESKVNQELIMMTALAMTHLAAEIYSDKVDAEKIQDLCGLIMEGKVKDNTETLLKMVPKLMNISKKMDVESKLRVDTPEITTQEALPEELMEALNEAEEIEEEYARVRD